jgi:E3 ubiquitin-protein ligase TRIP12
LFSLNHEKRRRELLRVSRENSTIAKRIIDRKPNVNPDDWTASWSRNLSYLDNISRYDVDWHESKV